MLDIVWTFRGLLELLPDPRLDSGEERASFLYDPQLWGKRLESVEALRAELNAAGERHEALSLDGSGIDLIVGDGMPTPTAARRAPTLGFEIEVSSAGDGTVAHVCSDLENVRKWFAMGVSHGNLVKDARTVRALRDILVRGTTDLLRVTPSQLGRGGTTPEAGRWYSPAEAALVVDDSARRSHVGRRAAVDPTRRRRPDGRRDGGGRRASAAVTRPARGVRAARRPPVCRLPAAHRPRGGHAARRCGGAVRRPARRGVDQVQEPGPVPGRRVDATGTSRVPAPRIAWPGASCSAWIRARCSRGAPCATSCSWP